MVSQEQRRQAIASRYQRDFPEVCCCLLDDAQASLNHLYVPHRHQQYVRTSNLAERAFEEERRRTKVIPQLWEEGGLVKLVFAVLIRVSERWGKKCFSEFEQQQIRSLRRRLKLDKQEVPSSPPVSSPESEYKAKTSRGASKIPPHLPQEAEDCFQQVLRETSTTPSLITAFPSGLTVS